MPENTKPESTNPQRREATRTASRRRRYERLPATRPLLSLTPTKWEMLRFLAECRFLSLPQLARLCCPAGRRDLSEKSARRHLRALFDAGLVDVLPVARAALAPPGVANDSTLLYGSAPNVYVPTAQVIRLLSRAGLIGEDVRKRPVVTYGPKNGLFLAHELAVRDVRVWLEGCARENRDDQALLRWVDGPEAAIDLGREIAPRRVLPDAWFIYRVQGGERPTVLVGLVEVDRGTERGDRRWQEKVAGYGALFAGDRLRQTTGYRNARVLVLTSGEGRRDQVARLISRCAAFPLAQRFWIAAGAGWNTADLTQLCWRRPGDDALSPLAPVGLGRPPTVFAEQ